MGECKTMVFGNDNQNSLLGLLAPMLQQRGLDPNMVMAMMNNRNGFGGEGGWFIWVIFLFFLMGWGGNGFGGFGGRNGFGQSQADLANLINNDSGRDMLMQAINGNGSKIGELSTLLNCNINSIRDAINALQTQMCNIGNQIGMSGQQIINAIQSGDCNIASQLASCCCDIKSTINTVNVGLERGFSSIAFEAERNKCDLQNTIKDSTAQIVAGQRAAEMREMQRDIAERDRKISEQAVIINNGQQTAIFGQMIQQATAPIVSAIGVLQKDVDNVKCKLPETATIPYSPVVGVPNCLAAQYGLGTFGNFGFVGQWG